MLIPRFWAEARLQYKDSTRQITVRRFGWSDADQADAQSKAETRAVEAMERLKAGEKLPRRELKRGYNGSEGVPIREEIISVHRECVVTRNAYGARCLNTPNVLFVDVDLATEPGCGTMAVSLLLLWVAAGMTGWWMGSKVMGVCLGIGALMMFYPLSRLAVNWYLKMKGGADRIARNHVEKFLAEHREWNVRLYRTPAGYRVLAMHDLFEPNDPRVSECFQALRADPVYVRMCLNQQCFRARVSPKPWRIGVRDHIKKGVWPVPPEKLAERTRWIERYEAASVNFASCTYVDTLGSGSVNAEVRFVQELHDDLCKATSSLPIA